MNISTDSEFPPYWAQEVADIINQKTPGQAQVKTIESPWGHLGCVRESQRIGDHIARFIAELET